jgi:vesicle coat complex subunit
VDEADKSIEAYEKLYKSVPSIGFLSRKKRIIAFLKITKMTQQMIDDQDISEEQALYLLSILARKCARFQKAAMMVALNLASINRKQIQLIGFRYANEMRCNLQMLPVDDEISNQP